MRLTVLSVAYPFAPVHPDTAGGAEQVLGWLDAALVAAGHRSIVVACEGSRVAGELRAVPACAGALTPETRALAQARHRAMIREVLRREPVDLVHMHGIDAFGMLPPPGPPTLVTLHLPPSWYPADAFRPLRPDTFLLPVSAWQQRACPPSPVLLDAIENGVPVEALAGARHAPRRFALFLGRICPEKGPDIAVAAAKLADVPLLVAGGVFDYPEHRAYFEQELRPRLDSRRKFIGPVGFARKRRLLTAARCVLIPSLATETSSLVAREAAACGTPVISFATGALPDTVEDGITGFLVKDTEGMARAIGRTGEIDRGTCRAVAKKRFDLGRMTGETLALYRRIAARGRTQAAP